MKISEEERIEFVKLVEEARNTPVIQVGTMCLSESAWDKVAHKMDEFGKKYGFNAREIQGINPKTGEIVKYQGGIT